MKNGSGRPYSAALVVIVTLVVCLLGCAPGVTFNRGVYSGKTDAAGRIAIRKVVDNRGGANIKNEPERLGTVRGGVGNPFPVVVENGNTVADEVAETVKLALSQCGFTVTSAGAPALDVIVNHFWCDGIHGYKVDMDVTLNLVAADGNTVVFSERITGNTGFSVLAGFGPMEKAYNEMMDIIGKRTAAMAKSKGFIDALQKAK